MTFIIAINTARIKVYQIQERLEQFIKAKQEWTHFITNISTELQLPIHLRLDALYLIKSNKEQYLNLLNMDYELPYSVKEHIKNKMDWRRKQSDFHISLVRNHGLTISDITFDIATEEGQNLKDAQLCASYHHDKEINLIYDELYSEYSKKLQTHQIKTIDNQTSGLTTSFGSVLFSHLTKNRLMRSIKSAMTFI
jgi:hypothetical protein